MTREEAIKSLEHEREYTRCMIRCSPTLGAPSQYKLINALDMAIEALQERPNNYAEVIAQLEAEIDSSDKYIREYDGSTEQIAYNKGMRNALKIVKEMSQERPKGRWEHLGGDEWGCTNCGHVISTEGSWEDPSAKFCEECGADMRESE